MKSGISFRAILVGLALVVLTCFVVCYAELVTGRIQIGFLQMPPAVIGIFFFLVLANTQLKALGQRLSLNARELMMVYCMMLVAAMVASRGVLEKIIPLLVTPNYFANSSNEWQTLFFPHIKKWMVSFDPAKGVNQPAAKQFFESLSVGNRIPWQDWIVPLAAWGALVLLIVFAFLCLATILRRQWVDEEKLSFPLVQLPIGLVQEQQGKPLLKNRLLWGGVALPAIVFTINGLHASFPSVPEITLSLFINPFLTNPPWNSMYWTALYFSFAAIGFFFLLPSDVLFAIWFFAIFARLQTVVAAAYNMETSRMPLYGTPIFVAYQTVGAYIVLAAYLFYAARAQIKRVVLAAFDRQRADDGNELMPYKIAFWGLIVSFLLVVKWSMLAGTSAPVALLEFGVFVFVVALVMARSTAEAGMLMTETTFRPTDLYVMFAPLRNLGPGNITALAFFDTAFMRDQRGLLLTGFLDGLKMTDGVNARRRSFLPVFLLGIFAAMLFAGYLHIALPYQRGGITMYGYVYQDCSLRAFRHYESALRGTDPATSWQAPVFFVVGLVVTAFLAYMRAMFHWWPLHPLGYALSVSWTSSVFWFSCFIAWLIKTVVLRYGGMKLYVKARPWFLGMILGEFGMAVIWAIINALTDAPTPTFPWP